MFLKATGKFGTIESIGLPELKWKSEDFSGGGSIGSRELALVLDKLELKFVSNSYDRDLLVEGVAAPGRTSQWKVMGSMIVPNEEERPLKVDVTGSVMELSRSEMKPASKFDTTFVVRDITYYREVVDGAELYEIDLLNQILRVNGTDLMATRRRNLGR